MSRWQILLLTTLLQVLEHPAFSSHFFSFLEQNLPTTMPRFKSLDIRGYVTTVLKGLPKYYSYFQQCFQAWYSHWNMCIKSECEYLEGDHPP